MIGPVGIVSCTIPRGFINSRLLLKPSIFNGSMARLSIMDPAEVQHSVRLVFRKSVSAVNPPDLVQREILVLNNKLHVREKSYDTNNNCYVVGFGKCVIGMAEKVEEILGTHLVKGIISIPCGFMASNELCGNKVGLSGNSRIDVFEGAKDNLPDNRAEFASKEVKNLVESLKETDILLVLVSGGGSSLLTLPKPPLGIEDKLKVIKLLGKAGANIVDMNIVRKKLSLVKGGGLAKLAYPCRVVSLILSDVIGDPLDIIASGPTVLNHDEDDAALKVIAKYDLIEKIPPSVLEVLNMRCSDTLTHDHVQNILIGNNKIALEAASRECTSLGFSPVVVCDSISGLVSDVAETYSSIIVLLSSLLQKKTSPEQFIRDVTPILDKIEVKSHVKEAIFFDILVNGADSDNFCLIFGGEPTVKVTGNGVGGRNQELALRMAVKLHELEVSSEDVCKCNIVFLSGGTDGIDGPTDAAGAIAYSGQVKHALEEKLDPYDFINRNDSHNFFLRSNKGKDIIVTGHTGVNVMDIHILIVQKKVCTKKG